MGAREDRIREQISGWRDALLDLTGRNRLLRFRHTRTASLEIREPGAQAILDRLRAGRVREWPIQLPPEGAHDSNSAAVTLAPDDRTNPEDDPRVLAALESLDVSGSGGDLWLSLGRVRLQGQHEHTPLFLLPARVEDSDGWRLRWRDDEVQPNPALVAHAEDILGLPMREDRLSIHDDGAYAAFRKVRAALESVGGSVDDHVGLLSARKYEQIRRGSLGLAHDVVVAGEAVRPFLLRLASRGRVGIALGAAAAPSTPKDQPGDALRTTKTTAKDVRAACAGLARRASTEFMDRGIWVLYLGIGMLRWSDPADQRAEPQDSPLLLLPVRLEPAAGGSDWKLGPTEDEALVNPALWLKLESELGISLPDLEPEEPISVAPMMAQIARAIASQHDWSIHDRVVLSTFSFHKEAMYRDLRDNFDQIVGHPIVGALATDAAHQGGDATADFDFEPVPEAMLDSRFPPEQAATILDADASQRQCIAAALGGASFVMDGPPGTGKSQTIANMIAELVAAGKTVLFVSEKAAALDVVHNRLARVGLDEYVLELHSHKTTRAAVASALGTSLARRPVPSPQLARHDLEDAGRRRAQLSRYANSLNNPDQRLGGKSLHHLLGWIAELQHLPQAPVAWRAIEGPDELAMIRELAERLRSSWEVVERGDDFVWRGTSLDRWNATTEQRVQAMLDALLSALDGLRTVSEAVAQDVLLDLPRGPRDVKQLSDILDVLARRPSGVPAEWLYDIRPADLRAVAEQAKEQAGAWQRARDAGVAAAGGKWRAVDRPSTASIRTELTRLNLGLPESLDAADAARLARAASQLADRTESVYTLGTELSARLGLRSAGLTLDAAETAVALARLAASDDRPPAAWLIRPQGVERARTALGSLQPRVADEREAQSSAEIFDERVLALDLDGLAHRFANEHRGFKKLGGAFRADRDALAVTAPTIKPKAAIAAIGRAQAWKSARAALETEAQRHATALSTAWSGLSTDLDRVARQIELATQAERLAKDRIADRRRFGEALSGGAPGSDLAEKAIATDDAVARLRSDVPNELAGILDRPLDRAARAFRHATAALDAIADIARHVDAIRGAIAPVARAMDAVEASREAASVEAAHTESARRQGPLGEWATLDLDPDALDTAVRWSSEIRDAVGLPLGRTVAARLVVAVIDRADLDAAAQRWDATLEPLLSAFDLDRRGELARDLEADFDDAAALLEQLRDTRGDIEIWIQHASAVEALHHRGLAPAVAYCAERRVSASDIVGVVRRSALEATADEMLEARRDALGPTRSRDRDRLVHEYAALDTAVVRDAVHRVMEAANRRRPNTVLGVATIIANESQKKTRHMPVARLLAQTAPVAQAIKPCFMMSPLSVSQFLSPDMRFDVVIFDEASQVRPEDAVNALYRGDAMIVAGDQKQLPPTSFFEQTTDEGEEWTEDALADYGSVLDLAKASGAYRSLSLRWHYRSRHENLIAFSNHKFYEGQLVTFPSPAEESEELGVELVRVDGVYRRGTSRDNPVEALCVADRVFAHAARGERSIGVVAFSEAQASFIEEVLRRDPRRHEPLFADLFSEDRLASLFVKNLENVQGDERDTIIFSVGYGPDEHGKLTMTFGPVNREGGRRRLNVAVTRARKRVEVVCSFAPEQLAASANDGVTKLREYLEFAERGPVVLTIDDAAAVGGEPESPFEESVLRTLRSAGHSVAAQVGTAGYRIDLAVRHPHQPGRFAIGIECDGAMYHSSRVARDRDRLREQILLGLGWTLHRIWGPSWYRDRSGEERRLNEAIERAVLDASPGRREPVSPPVRVDVAFEDVSFDAAPTWTESYVATILPPGKALDVTEPTAIREIRSMLVQAVTDEGPIVGDLLARRVVDAWHCSLTEKRRAVIQRAIDAMTEAGTFSRRGNAYVLPHQPTDVVRVPEAADQRSQREIKHVPDIELAEAIVRLVAEARIVSDAELVIRVARMFGWRRTGPAIQATLARIVDGLVDEGRLSRRDGLLREPESNGNPGSVK
jgi:very-short-patch-repair endonuclease